MISFSQQLCASCLHVKLTKKYIYMSSHEILSVGQHFKVRVHYLTFGNAPIKLLIKS